MRSLAVLVALLLVSSVAGADKLDDGRLLLRKGELEAARAAAEKLKTSDGRVLLAETHRAAGRTAEARALLEQVVKKEPRLLRARAQLGLVYEETGEKKLADAVWNGFYDDHDAGKLDQSKPENLLYLAIAARHLEDFQGANQTLQEAIEKDPKLVEANLEWGWLFLGKYNAADAEACFDDVLELDASNPDAHAGMARVKLEQGYDVRAAEKHIEKALATNPRHVRALLIRAELQIDNSEYGAAKTTLGEVLAQNPGQLEAHTLAAAIDWLRDELPAYEASRKKVFALNPRYAPFYHTIAEFAVKEHRYKEAVALEEEALKVDPKYDAALAAIGTGYLRMGDEDKGLKYLREAGDRDKFNVRTYNMLNLFEETIPRDYEVIAPAAPKGVFKLRVPKDERAIIERYLPPTLGRAFDEMVKRYAFTPALPITFELYNDPDQYSVRTVGLPNLGALGVCFGRVVTALSPSNGNVNWGMILWHELAHVFHIQASNSRVPRWYTEGLAEVETLITRPEWRRENEIDVWMAMSSGKLPSLGELNTRFLRAEDINDMVVAYYLSAVAMEFISKRWGMPKVVEGLRLYGKGKDTSEVLPAITGLTIAELDAEFRKHLEKRLEIYKHTFKVELGEYDDVTALEKAAAARPTDPEAHADLALGHLAAEDGEKAMAAAAAALKLAPRNRKALLVQAEVKSARGDAEGARAGYEALIAAGGDGYEARMKMAGLARGRGDGADVEAQLKKAIALDPERSEPHAVLAEIYGKSNREADAIAALERYVMLEQMEWAPLKKLVDKHAARSDWAKVRKFGEMGLYLNPFDAELHMTLGKAYEETGATDRAIFEYDSALLSQPPLRRPAVAQLGLARAHGARRDVARAKKALAEALKLEPDNAEALALSKKLK